MDNKLILFTDPTNIRLFVGFIYTSTTHREEKKNNFLLNFIFKLILSGNSFQYFKIEFKAQKVGGTSKFNFVENVSESFQRIASSLISFTHMTNISN